jgi:hypothetical protein
MNENNFWPPYGELTGEFLIEIDFSNDSLPEAMTDITQSTSDSNLHLIKNIYSNISINNFHSEING